MKIGEAIRYFERELGKAEEAETYEASKADPDEELLHAWCYEREALLLALGALRLAQKYGQSEEFAKSPIHNLFVRLAPNASTALKNDERRSEEETK